MSDKIREYSLIQFHEYTKAMGISVNEEQDARFVRYYELLTEWNSFMNLTAITDYEEVVLKHFTDSLSIVKAFPGDGLRFFNRRQTLIDIGTGAGFPGIPLKIVFPELEVTLLDSLQKRVTFLNEVIAQLGLKGITALHGRAEDFSGIGYHGTLRESFDLCVSRAVARLSVLSEYCLPYVKEGGYFIAYKSEKTESELAEAKHALSVLGGEIEGQREFFLADSGIYRNLVVIKKKSPTPKKYPRKAGIPAKEPL